MAFACKKHVVGSCRHVKLSHPISAGPLKVPIHWRLTAKPVHAHYPGQDRAASLYNYAASTAKELFKQHMFC